LGMDLAALRLIVVRKNHLMMMENAQKVNSGVLELIPV